MIKRRPMPPARYLRECFDVREDGRIFWRVRPTHHFRSRFRTADGNAANWNSAHAGTEAFTTTSGGYPACLIIRPDGGKFKLYAHRVIWKMTFGEEPDEIDHIDGDRTNNRVDNLRNVTRPENTKNVRLRSDNRSGCHGVTWATREGKWAVQAPGTMKGLGHFHDLSKAIAVRKEAERAAGYHPNHGRK